VKKADVRIGGVYEARVSGKRAHVRIDYECTEGGWMGANLDSGHSIRVRTAGRLRKPVGIAPPTSELDVWRQWQRLKESNPGTALLFQVADRFEAYGDDAHTVASVFGEPYDWRDGDNSNGPTISFPYASLEATIRKLVAAGHRVAVCERVQPGEARGKPVEKIIIPV